MSKEIIKGAFDEGYETDIGWNNSESNAIKNDINDFDFSNRKIVQSCIKTVNIINVFKNIKHAEHYRKTELKGNIRNKLNQNGMGIEMAILSNWKCYGYKWSALKLGSLNKVTVDYSELDEKLYYCIDKSGNIEIFNNLSKLSRHVGGRIDTRIRKKDITPYKGYIALLAKDYDPTYDYMENFNINSIAIYDNETKKIKLYDNINKASKAIRVSRTSISRRLDGTGKNTPLKQRYTITNGRRHDYN